MLQIVQNYKTGELSVKNVPDPALQPGGLIVQNHFSLISAGTERLAVATAQKNLAGKAQSRPDLVDKVKRSIQRDGLLHTISIVKNKLDTPQALGYSSSGVVTAVADHVRGFAVGDRVACAGQGYASHAEKIFIPQNLAVKVPEHVDLDEAAFATLGAIAMQGVRQASVEVGEYVAVIGLGLLGLLTVQILKAAGCIVLGMDIDKKSCHLAQTLGADLTSTKVKDFIQMADALSQGNGMDKVIITASTKNNEPILSGGEILRKKGALVIVGMVPTDIPRSPFYEKEIDVRYSCSYGPGRYDSNYEEQGIDYPYPYVRWTENRNMQSFLDLVGQNKINIKEIITHRFKIQEAQAAYDLITGQSKNRDKYIGILFEYNTQKTQEESFVELAIKSQSSAQSGDLNIGFIGAGNFAQGFLIPPLKKLKNVHLEGVSTSKGITSNAVAEKFGFHYATTDNNQILKESSINAVFIATRHHLHANQVVSCLKSNKPVYVEKPLALDEEELKSIQKANKKNPTIVMVGFNRRFSPHTSQLLEFLPVQTPKMIHYRINAGYIPAEHWTQNPAEGGGRIIGEVCHFIDFTNFVTRSKPVRLYAESLDSVSGLKDTLTISIKYNDGSVGNIVYSSVGDKSLPKEKIEVFSTDFVGIIDDFRTSQFICKGKTTPFKTSKQDKGHAYSVNKFIDAVQDGGESPIPFEESVLATQMTFMVHDSLSKGIPLTF